MLWVLEKPGLNLRLWNRKLLLSYKDPFLLEPGSMMEITFIMVTPQNRPHLEKDPTVLFIHHNPSELGSQILA